MSRRTIASRSRAGQGQERRLDHPALLAEGDGVFALARAVRRTGQDARVLERDQPRPAARRATSRHTLTTTRYSQGPSSRDSSKRPRWRWSRRNASWAASWARSMRPSRRRAVRKNHALVPLDQDGEGLRVAGPGAAHPLGGLRGDGTVGQVGWCQAQVSRRSLRASRGDTRRRTKPLTAEGPLPARRP